MVCLLFRAGEAGAEAVAELLAALGEAGAYDVEEAGRLNLRDGGLLEDVEAQHRAVDSGARKEGPGGDALQDAGSGVELNADGKERHIAGLGGDAVRHLALDEKDGQRRRS